MEIVWGITGIGAPGVFFLGLGLMALPQSSPFFAQLCFYASGGWAASVGFMWLVTTPESIWLRITSGVMLGVFVFVVVPQMIRLTSAQSPPSQADSGPNGVGSPTINAPNNHGIVTQGQRGDNYINNDPRAWGLTQDQWTRFRATLTPVPEHSNAERSRVYIRLDDLLSKNLKDQLVTLIASAPGWESWDQGDHMVNTLGVRGIVIDVPDPANPSEIGKVVMNAFLASGLQPSPVFAGPFGGVRIVVGSPP